jgi:hypothetical protein
MWTYNEAKSIANKLNGRIVGSVKTKGKSEHDLDILIHEYTHIYQRYNKETVEKQITNMGFKKSRKRYGIERIRSNPDLDEYIYKDKDGSSCHIIPLTIEIVTDIFKD